MSASCQPMLEVTEVEWAQHIAGCGGIISHVTGKPEFCSDLSLTTVTRYTHRDHAGKPCPCGGEIVACVRKHDNIHRSFYINPHIQPLAK